MWQWNQNVWCPTCWPPSPPLSPRCNVHHPQLHTLSLSRCYSLCQEPSVGDLSVWFGECPSGRSSCSPTGCPRPCVCPCVCGETYCCHGWWDLHPCPSVFVFHLVIYTDCCRWRYMRKWPYFNIFQLIFSRFNCIISWGQHEEIWQQCVTINPIHELLHWIFSNSISAFLPTMSNNHPSFDKNDTKVLTRIIKVNSCR